MLKPVPVRRFRCPEHGTFSWLPPFLCRFLRYLADVVHAAQVEFAETTLSVALVLAEDGPSMGAVWRWVQPLESPLIGAWLEERLLGLCPAWRKQWLPLVEADHPQPSEHRPFAWTTLQKLRSLTRLLSQKVGSSPAAILQLARLKLSRRSSSVL